MSSAPATARTARIRAPMLALALMLALTACGWNPKAYVVRTGDTLYLIAWRYDLRPEDLAKWNGIDNPDLIYPGQRLWLSESKGPRRGAASQASKQKRKVELNSDFDATRKEKWSWPLVGAGRGDVIEKFSWNGEKGKKGMSIAGQEGAAVLAARSGKVVYVGADIAGYGNMVVLQHDELYLSAYMHNENVMVKVDSWVKRGEKIAVMGKSGTNRVKLYFQVRYDAAPIDPLSVLP